MMFEKLFARLGYVRTVRLEKCEEDASMDRAKVRSLESLVADQSRQIQRMSGLYADLRAENTNVVGALMGELLEARS